MRTHEASGRVIALLRNAVYLESDDGRIISIADGEIDGPLTLRVANVTPLLATLKARPGETFKATQGALHIEGAAQIAWARTPEWAPHFPEKVGPPNLRLDASNALAQAIAGAERLEGFGPLAAYIVGTWCARRSQVIPLAGKARRINPRATITKPACAGWRQGKGSASEGRLRMCSPHIYVPGGVTTNGRTMPLQAALPSDALSSRALAALDLAREAAHLGNYAEVSASLIALIGLGPGLTPSGDDLVAGIVAALVWQARIGCVPNELTRQVVEAVREAAPSRTNRISARLLWHACDGVLYAPAMKLGAALLSGDVGAMLMEARQLFSIGHTTGVDLSVGLLAGTLLDVGREAVTHNDTRSVPV